MARGRSIPPAIARRAQVRAAFQCLSRNGDSITAGVTVGFRSAARIDGDAARLVLCRRMLVAIPVVGPLPRVADHVEQPEAIWRISADRRGAFEAIADEVLPWELPLPNIGEVAPLRLELVTPGELRVFGTAPGGIFPLRFGRQALAGPRGIGGGVVVGDMH